MSGGSPEAGRQRVYDRSRRSSPTTRAWKLRTSPPTRGRLHERRLAGGRAAAWLRPVKALAADRSRLKRRTRPSTRVSPRRRRAGGSGRRPTLSRPSRVIPRSPHQQQQQQTHSRGGEKERVLKRIRRMEEELYDEMAEADEMYGRDKDPECRMNKQLLRELTDHVCRRNSGDAVWDAARSAKLRDDLVGFMGIVALYTGASCLLEEAAKRVWAAFFSKR